MSFVDAGGNFRWPKLVGKKGDYAKSEIEKDVRCVRVVILRQGTVRIENFCCNRVFVYVDDSGHVVDVPTIG